MNIKDILAMPAGSKIGGFTVTVKTAKKCWKVEFNNWQAVLFMDSTGEILADVNLGLKYEPIHQSAQLQINEAEIQLTDAPNNGKLGMNSTRHKLVIHKWCLIPAQGFAWNDDDDAASWAAMRDDEINSKILCRLTERWLGVVKRFTIPDVEREGLKDLVRFVRKALK